jgi:hypothetical protein
MWTREEKKKLELEIVDFKRCAKYASDVHEVSEVARH